MKEHYNELPSTPQIKLKNFITAHSRQTLSPNEKPLFPSHPNSPVTLQVGRENINKTVQIYSWRSKTSLPILKIEQYRVSPLQSFGTSKKEFIFDASGNNNPSKWEEMKKSSQNLMEYVTMHPEVPLYQVSIKMEDFRCRLYDMNTFSFPQVMYLLKEMLVGFEVLVDIFGFFDPTDRMVVLTANHRWKMWSNPDLNETKTNVSPLTLADFLVRLLSMAERHSLSTSQSKTFFAQMRHNINTNSITFLKVLEMVKEYISVNKILQVNKVTLPGLACCPVEKKTYLRPENKNKSFSYQIKLGIEATRELENQDSKQIKKYGTMKPGSTYFPAQTNPQEPKGMVWQASSGQLFKYNHIDRFPISPKNIGQEMTEIFTPKKQPKEITHNRVPSIDDEMNKKLQSANRKKSSRFMETPLKESRKKSFENQRRLSPVKFQNVFEQPQSSPLLKVTSAKNLINKGTKACTSSIFNSDLKKVREKKYSQNYLFNEPFMIKIKTPVTPSPTKSQLDGKCPSPYNSSSTKELQNSRQIRQSDVLNSKMKANDLMSKERNNHSVINVKKKEGRAQEEGKRNLAVSNQFHDRGHHLQVPSKAKKEGQNHNHEWKSTITGLFSDTQSIKHLKESIKMKNNNHEQIYEKDHLKDVKLDLLDKFGRTAHNIVFDEGDSGFNTMQLIEQVDEIKSGLESQRDPENGRGEQEESGFHFETQMYVINPKKSQY